MSRLLRTSAAARIYPFDERRALEVTRAVKGGTISRNLSGDSAFNLVLTDIPAIQRIAPGDWVRLGLSVSGQMRTKLWGRVDASRDGSVATDTGGVYPLVNVSGRDHSSVFHDSAVVFNPWMWTALRREGVQSVAFPFFDERTFTDWGQAFSGLPNEWLQFILEVLFNRALSGDQRFVLPSCMVEDANADRAMSLIDYVAGDIATSFVKPGLKGVAYDSSILFLQDQGSLWGLLQDYANAPINELFCRVSSDGTPQLVHRERPFPTWRFVPSGIGVDSSPWDALPGVRVRRRDIAEYNVQRSSAERMNYFLVTPRGFGVDFQDFYYASTLLSGAVPVLNLESIRRHGLNRFETSVFYTGFDAANSSAWTTLVAFWSIQTASWYWLNDRFWAGQVVIPSLVDGEIGERLWVEQPNGLVDEFYIESVSWNWQVDDQGGASGTTTFGVTRGLRGLRGSFTRSGGRAHFERDGGYPLPTSGLSEISDALGTLESIQADALTFANGIESSDPSVKGILTPISGPYSSENLRMQEVDFQQMTENRTANPTSPRSATEDRGPAELGPGTDPVLPTVTANITRSWDRVYFTEGTEVSTGAGDPGRFSVATDPVQLMTDYYTRISAAARTLHPTGISFLSDARPICHLHLDAALEDLARDFPGSVWDQPESQWPRYIVPPQAWWYNIVAPLICYQTIFEGAGLDPSDFSLYNGYRPQPYESYANRDIRTDGRPERDPLTVFSTSSAHIRNHAVDIRPRAGVPEATRRQWLAALRAFADVNTNPVVRRWNVGLQIYRTGSAHIDAWIPDDELPDGLPSQRRTARRHAPWFSDLRGGA